MSKTKELTGEAAAEWIAGHPEIAAANAQSVADATTTGAGPTPGPWEAYTFRDSEDTRAARVRVIRPETPGVKANPDICHVYAIGDDGRPGGEMEANAQLIAAAPDLLAALQAAKKALADILDNHPDVWPTGGLKEAQTPERRAWRKRIEGYRDAARAAIRAAEGKG